MPCCDSFKAKRSTAMRGSKALNSHRPIRRSLLLYLGAVLRRVVREAHGRGAGSAIRFDIHDSIFARSEGTFQSTADIGGLLNIFAMAAKGIHQFLIALIAQLASDLAALWISRPAAVETDDRDHRKIVPHRGVHLHGVH